MNTLFKKLFPIEKEFFPYLLKLAAPIAIEMVLVVVLGLTDIIMISRFSAEVGVASVSLANQLFNNLLLIFFGLGSGAAVFFSRYWGRDDFKAMRTTFGLTTALVLVAAVLGMVGFYFGAYWVMSIMSSDPAVVYYGSQYLRIITISFPFVAVSLTVSSLFRSIEKSHYPMWIAFFTVFFNIFLNWVFIFGNLGAPAMGVAGAAIAVVVSWVADSALNIILFMSAKNPIRKGFKDYFHFISPEGFTLLKQFFGLTFFVVVADLMFGLGFTAYRRAFAIAGTEVVAAFAAVDSFLYIFYTIVVAIAGSCGIVMGIAIGENNLKRAKLLAKIFIRLNFVSAIPLALIIFAILPFIANIFGFSGLTASYLRAAVLLSAILFGLRTLEYLLNVGILRTGGDVRFYTITQTITMWVIAVPLILWLAWLGVPPLLLYSVVILEELIRNAICFVRYKNGLWIKQF
ncbi:MAG: MATE family efflux transporter [Spirochaetaceae bacterium]|nr:MATE family efflux transporter [Spirochaetaceae bacterium]